MNAKSSWNIYRTRFLVRARRLSEPLAFTDSLGREHSGQPGDYLVETSDGVRRITSRALFEDIYVPLGAPGISSHHSSVQKPPASAVVARSAPQGSPGERTRATA
jgi:hypothetical protein